MERKVYGSQPDDGRSFTSLAPSVGDPEFETDAQNNDHQFLYPSDGITDRDGDLTAGESR